MHIDWFVFFAQIVNFLILLLLMKRFLYGRILRMIDLREARIAERFAEAEKASREAEETLARHQASVQEFEASARELLAQAHTEAQRYRQQLMEEVRREIEQIQKSWVETLCAERATLLQELRRLTGAEVVAIARQVLRQLADVSLEERIAAVLARRIESLDPEERSKIRSLAADGTPLRIVSALALPDEARARLAEAVHRGLGPDLGAAQFETAGDVLAGCELRIDGYKVAWSVQDYLDTLEEKFHLCLYRDAGEGIVHQTDGGTIHGHSDPAGRAPVVS